MLLSKTAVVRWNAKNKAYYEGLGYTYTQMKDEFVVDVRHLPHASHALVNIRCDYCGCEYDIKWVKYFSNHKSGMQQDACFDCKWIKGRDSLEAKCGSRNILDAPMARERQQATNMLLYGATNPFASDAIKQKIANTNLEKYGVESYTKTEEYKVKTIETNMRKYGVPSHMLLPKYRAAVTGENSPVWKGGVAQHRQERATYEYRTWRSAVFQRDSYTCQCCSHHGGDLEAHHICNWKDNPELRYDIDNGITLCGECHTKFHSKFGKRNNTRSQLESFLCNGEKVC